MKTFFLIPILALLLSSCSNPPYRGSDVLGADEFVMDSYKIREGKFAILEMEGQPYQELSPQALDTYKDLIQEGDILTIAVYHPTRTDLVTAIATLNEGMGFPVREGKILLPDAPAIAVQGLSLEEAREKIQEQYRQEIRDVDVFISYKERTERKVELAGLVAVSSVPVDGRIRLFEILSMAKVPPDANLFKSYIVRDNAMLPVDLYKLIKEGDMSQNVVMRGGDKIYIAEPSASTIMVLGEVGREQLVSIPNGFMTLRHAIAAAGGLTPTADRSYIQVVRGNIVHPKIYTLHWEHVVRLRNDSMLLLPGDIVYVAATPITEWNRFVSQILPTVGGVEMVTRGARSVGIIVQ